MKYFLLPLLLSASAALSAEWTLPADNDWSFIPGTDVGIPGGVDQYYPGGASERIVGVNGTDHLNVSLAPYGANPANPATTGTASAGASTVVVASATGFEVTDLVRLVSPYAEISTLIATGPATADGNVGIYLNGVTVNIAVVNGDTAAQVATKLRAGTYSGWTTGGSSTTVTWTANATGDQYQYLIVNAGGTGFTSTASTVDGGAYSSHTIASIAGTSIGITPAVPAAGGATDAVFAVDNAGAINAAITAATAEQVVYIPGPGTFIINSGLSINTDEITLRGDGPGVSIIKAGGAMGAMLQVGTNTAMTANKETVSGTKTKGSTALTVADSTDYLVGQIIAVEIFNDTDDTRIQAGAPVRIGVFGEEAVLNYVAKVTAVSAGVVTITPALPVDCTNVTVNLYQKLAANTLVEKVGIEDLTFDGDDISTVQNGIGWQQTAESWVRNCQVTSYNNYGVKLDDTYKMEVRHSTIGPGRPDGTNSAGVLAEHTQSLIEDNIILSNSSTMQENAGSIGNAWLFNCLPTNVGGNDMLMNHGAHNIYNLYEGNAAHSWKSDGYFGSASHNIMFRNWFTGYDGTYTGLAVYAKRFTRNFVEAGNVYGWDGIADGLREYGTPNIGNSSYTGTAWPTTGDFWADWKITGTVADKVSAAEVVVTVNKLGTMVVGSGSGGNGICLVWHESGVYKQSRFLIVDAISGLDVTLVTYAGSAGDPLPVDATNVEVWVGQSLFQELDQDVEASFIQASNYMSDAAGTGAITDSISPDTLPNSLAYTAKPAWFGSLTWPPVNPSSPTFSYEIIPAGYRYINDAAPPPSSTAVTVSGNASVGGTLSIGN